MTKEKEYECEHCKKRVKIDFTKEPSFCCGMEMKPVPLEVCLAPPSSAEHARPMDDEEPCDDSRG